MAIDLKCVLVGSGMVGKTTLIRTIVEGSCPEGYILPESFGTYQTTMQMGGHSVNLGLWDTAGQDGLDRLRPISYTKTTRFHLDAELASAMFQKFLDKRQEAAVYIDVFLLCFALTKHASFEDIEEKWAPEVMHFCPKTPTLLIGIDGVDHSTCTNETGSRITSSQGRKLMERIGARGYLECTTHTQLGVKEVFEGAVRVAMGKPIKSKRILPI